MVSERGNTLERSGETEREIVKPTYAKMTKSTWVGLAPARKMPSIPDSNRSLSMELMMPILTSKSRPSQYIYTTIGIECQRRWP